MQVQPESFVDVSEHSTVLSDPQPSFELLTTGDLSGSAGASGSPSEYSELLDSQGLIKDNVSPVEDNAASSNDPCGDNNVFEASGMPELGDSPELTRNLSPVFSLILFLLPCVLLSHPGDSVSSATSSLPAHDSPSESYASSKPRGSPGPSAIPQP